MALARATGTATDGEATLGVLISLRTDAFFVSAMALGSATGSATDGEAISDGFAVAWFSFIEHKAAVDCTSAKCANG